MVAAKDDTEGKKEPTAEEASAAAAKARTEAKKVAAEAAKARAKKAKEEAAASAVKIAAPGETKVSPSKTPRLVDHYKSKVIPALMKEFAHGQPPAVRRPLRKQTLREMGHFLGLMRKGNVSPADRSQFAAQFLAAGIAGQMLKGASNYRELAATFKAWYLCHIWKRRRAQT